MTLSLQSPHHEAPRSTPKARVIVAQIGARMHYAVPQAFQRLGMLAHFYTDLAISPAWRRLLRCWPTAWRPATIERLLTRDPQEIPWEQLTCLPRFGAEFHRRRRGARNDADLARVFDWSGNAFCTHVLQSGFAREARQADTLYTFAWGGLELLQAAKSLGLQTITEQYIAPFIERELLAEEQERHPNWERPFDTVADQYSQDRVRQEWEVADTILCPSAFVRDAVVQGGGAAEKCRIVPYAIDASPANPCSSPKAHAGPLRVVTVGAVGLRKGAPYLLEAARRLAGRAHFRMVGSCHLNPAARAEMAQSVELTGPVPRSQVAQHLDWADVFLLPSLCEGSATSTYEAMAAGLPVVCTHNTGSVIEDGLEGRVIPIRDPEAIVDALDELSV
ncbi:MAG: glycosyltransferase family 4 protein, partial [Planctomycetota bacterium]